jgi:hypothetical protein
VLLTKPRLASEAEETQTDLFRIIRLRNKINVCLIANLVLILSKQKMRTKKKITTRS